eukprot:SAG31_NODE_5143_length_2718_cov_1.647957_1_plen_59_part_00
MRVWFKCARFQIGTHDIQTKPTSFVLLVRIGVRITEIFSRALKNGLEKKNALGEDVVW